MKYITTTISFFILSLIAAILSLYFGSLTNKIEKNISDLNFKIKETEEKIKVNELEYTIHTNTDYLLKLKKIYLEELDVSSDIKFVNIDDLKQKNIEQILNVSIR